MRGTRNIFDVAVIGAGPSGSATALRLAELGHRVAIIERARFPRAHVGICLSDQTLALLAHLGLEHTFRSARFWRRSVTRVDWGAGDSREVDQRGFHVDRGRLDQALLDRACDSQAVLFQPAEVGERKYHETKGWSLEVGHSGQESIVSARFLVDAGGRHSALGGRRIKDSDLLLALHADWTFDTAPEADGLIEADDFGWLWFAQTAQDRGTITTFLDPRSNHALTRSNLKPWYLDRITCFSTLAKTSSWRLDSQVQACDATSSHAAEPLSDSYIRVGDAAMAVDPLSSQGVHLALLSGLQAAIVANTILRRPEDAVSAKRFYRARLEERVAKHKVRTSEEYARVAAERPTPFWLSRSKDAVPTPGYEPKGERVAPPAWIALSPTLQVETYPVIHGSFIEERRVLSHPNLETSIKYLGGTDVIPLLETLPHRLPFESLADLWRPFVSASQTKKIASWLLERRLLVGVPGRD